MPRRRLALAFALIPLAHALGACAGRSQDGSFIPKSYDGTLRVAPARIVFEGVRAGCVRSQTLALSNTSPDLGVAVTNVALPDASLSLGQRLPIELGPGETRNVDLHFSPGAPGRGSGDLELRTDEGKLHPYRIPVATEARAHAVPDAAVGPASPLDLVLVLDVSTTMNELAPLRAALLATLDRVASERRDVRFGLTTFENDVRVHGDGAFLEKEALLAELDSQLVADTWLPDPELPRQLLNFDLQENVLDALARSASEFPFRSDARRYVLLMTDDSFLEPPEVFSDGTPARHGYAQTAETLRTRGVRLFSIHAPIRGSGLSSGHDGAPSLVEQTGGAWFGITDVDRGTLRLESLLADLSDDRACS